MGTFRAEPEYAVTLEQLGIADYGAAMSFAGGRLVSSHRGRSVVELGNGLFLKRYPESPRGLRAELHAMQRLADAPGPDPVPLAGSGEGAAGAFLVTARPDGAVPLAEALFARSGEGRARLIRSVGERIRGLHDHGLVFPDLMVHHVFVGPSEEVRLIDVGRLSTRGPRRTPARDLAALLLSLPCGSAGPKDHVRFLTSYLGRRPRAEEPLLRRVERAYRRLDHRSRHRTDRLVALPAERQFLARQGIESFDELMAYDGPGAERLRRLPDRENWRIELSGRVFFVKRHRPVKGLARTPAAEEWEAIQRFRRAGIRAMRPVAFGEDVRKGSTIWVERAGGVPLDDLLRDGDVSDGVRRELVREAAGILRTMRSREMHHRDMYACHLIADSGALVGGRLTVIDLQRARRKPGLRSRWYVKDVAQLLHSAPRPPVTGADVARFLRCYFGVARLGRDEKSFARRVARKAARIG